MKKDARRRQKMDARAWRHATLALLIVSVVALAGWGQAPVYPMGLIIEPPLSEELEVSITTDKAEYQIGELVTISYEVNKPAYIYIWDITPEGDVQVVFPNDFYSWGHNNFVQAGAHTLPTSFPAAPPLGTEYLQILATTQPVDITAFPMSDPGLFQQQVEVQILGLLLEDQRTWNFTSFEIVDVAPPDYGTIVFTSNPTGASITLDGIEIGYTPRTYYVSQGLHRISISKPGYATYTAIILTFGTGSRTLHADLVPLFPMNTPPNASFTHSPPNPLVGAWVQFDASASSDPDGLITSYSWNFGDGTTGNGAVIWHRFNAGGSYPVTLTVTDNDAASDTSTQVVQVGPTNSPPVAGFVYYPPNPLVGAWVQFDASASTDSDGSIVSYSWNFGDGTTDTGVLVWHRFTSGSSFLVTLTVVDDDGASAQATVVLVVGSANNAPNAAFSYTPPTPDVGDWIRFDASSSSDSDGSIVSYQWSFGDGSPTMTGQIVYHQFTSLGSYPVTLTVTDDDGASDSASQTVDVGMAGLAPVASFTYSPLSPIVGQTVTFNATSSFDPDGTIVSYLWDLNGDGVTDTSGSTGTVTYASSGVVMVRLEVVDNDGLSSIATQPITISPISGPSGSPPMGTNPGIYVWGTDSWHVTVNAGAGWTTPRAYRIELRTDGTFQNVNDTFDGGVIPLGLVIEPTSGGKTLLFEGEIATGSIDHTFRVPDSNSIWMSLKYDIDGDGDLDESASFVYLRHSLVHPPAVPMVVGLPSGSSAELLPTLNFRIGTAANYTETVRWIFWRTTISALEGI
jgi:PKD repeat protein